MKRTNDPLDPRAAALDEALALWAESAQARGARADAQATTRGVFARIAADPEGRAYLPERAPFGYAAAAAALLAVGLTGAWLSNPSRTAPETPAAASDLEQGSLAVVRLVELEQLAVGR